MNQATHDLFTDDPHTIADTCLLVRLEQRRVTTRKRADRITEARIRAQENDASLTVNRHLFKRGPVRDLLNTMRRAYDTHKELTAPWVDKGPRVLPSANLTSYAETMEAFKDEIAQVLPDILNRWDSLVTKDIDERTGSGQKHVKRADYPTAAHAKRAFSIEWYCEPLPSEGDFRVEVPEAVKERHRDRLQDAVDGIRADLIQRLVTPLQAAAERLAVPIGTKGAVFRNSLIDNLQEAVKQARELNVGDDPDVADLVSDVERLLRGEVQSPEALRTQQGARDKAVEELTTIANRFRGLA